MTKVKLLSQNGIKCTYLKLENLAELKEKLQISSSAKLEYLDDEDEWVLLENDVDLNLAINSSSNSLRIRIAPHTVIQTNTITPTSNWFQIILEKIAETEDSGDCKVPKIIKEYTTDCKTLSRPIVNPMHAFLNYFFQDLSDEQDVPLVIPRFLQDYLFKAPEEASNSSLLFNTIGFMCQHWSSITKVDENNRWVRWLKKRCESE